MFSLQLARRIKFPLHWPNIGVDPHKPKQRLSPTPYTFENSPGSHSFLATENLYVGRYQWSQVYGGSLISPTLKKQDNLVLKVFSSDLFPCANIERDSLEWEMYGPVPLSENSYRYTDELMAWAEVHAYSKLQSLQGTIIPRFVDAFMVKSPDSDKEEIGIVMSRIRGPSIMDKCRELGSEIDGDTRWYPLALELARCVYKIHQLGITGLDMREDNILVVDNDPGSSHSLPSPRLFDFAFSRPTNFDQPEDMIRHEPSLTMDSDVDELCCLIYYICGADEGRPQYLRENGFTENYDERRLEFLEWARREHSDDPWIAAWWDKHFSDLKRRICMKNANIRRLSQNGLY